MLHLTLVDDGDRLEPLVRVLAHAPGLPGGP